jgi:ribosomal protein L16/L10AE
MTKNKNLKIKPKIKTSKKRKIVRTTVIHPKHRVSSHGLWLSWESNYKVCAKSRGNSEITLTQQKAFLKCIKSKGVRRIFRFRGSPFVDLTKKPAEVRMGKGRGTRISKTLLPLSPGQCFAELDVRRFPFRHKKLPLWFKKASHKLPRRINISNFDL